MYGGAAWDPGGGGGGGRPWSPHTGDFASPYAAYDGSGGGGRDPPYGQFGDHYYGGVPQQQPQQYAGDSDYRYAQPRFPGARPSFGAPQRTPPPQPYASAGSADYGVADRPRSPRAETPRAPPPRRQPAAPPTRTTAMCTRATVACLVMMCCAWPALLTAGGILVSTSNPQEQQRADFTAASEAFDTRTAPILLTTTAITVAENPARTLTPAYQLLGDSTPFPTTRTVVMHTSDRAVIPETLGPNLGSVTARITYRQGEDSTVGQTYTFVSPPITLTRPATKTVHCTPPYASICGTSTCCTDAEMRRQCLMIVRRSSQSSPVDFIPNGQNCRLGAECGTCRYRQTVSALCFVIKWSALTGWSADESMSSCEFPFLPTGQQYSDSDAGATLTIRAVDDPYLELQRMTGGTNELDGDGAGARSQGRGLILFGSLVLLLAICVVFLAKFCGSDVLTSDAIRRAFGIRARSSRVGDGAGSKAAAGHLDQSASFHENAPPPKENAPASSGFFGYGGSGGKAKHANHSPDAFGKGREMSPAPHAGWQEGQYGGGYDGSRYTQRVDFDSPERMPTGIRVDAFRDAGSPTMAGPGGGYLSPRPQRPSGAHQRWVAYDDDDL